MRFGRVWLRSESTAPSPAGKFYMARSSWLPRGAALYCNSQFSATNAQKRNETSKTRQAFTRPGSSQNGSSTLGFNYRNARIWRPRDAFLICCARPSGVLGVSEGHSSDAYRHSDGTQCLNCRGFLSVAGVSACLMYSKTIAKEHPKYHSKEPKYT